MEPKGEARDLTPEELQEYEAALNMDNLEMEECDDSSSR